MGELEEPGRITQIPAALKGPAHRRMGRGDRVRVHFFQDGLPGEGVREAVRSEPVWNGRDQSGRRGRSESLVDVFQGLRVLVASCVHKFHVEHLPDDGPAANGAPFGVGQSAESAPNHRLQGSGHSKLTCSDLRQATTVSELAADLTEQERIATRAFAKHAGRTGHSRGIRSVQCGEVRRDLGGGEPAEIYAVHPGPCHEL
jgi:hypothetical protein